LTLSRVTINIDDKENVLQFVLVAAAITKDDPKSARVEVGTRKPYDSVQLTPLSTVSGKVVASFGMVHVHLVRESTEDHDTAFSQLVLTEAQGLLRSKVFVPFFLSPVCKRPCYNKFNPNVILFG
jgi:hypothetical protein